MVRIDQNPTTTDEIEFEILTPDSDGCFTADPYKVEQITIYYAERSFNSGNFGNYNKTRVNEDLQEELRLAKKEACLVPSDDNLAKVSRIQSKIDASSSVESFNYSGAVAVKVFGNADNPAWIATDLDNALIENISEDEDGDPQYGHFKLLWNPLGMREGDYFICWKWMPNPAGDYLNDHQQFSLSGNTQVTTSIPTHFTKPEKYPTLMERYTAEHLKTKWSGTDLSPEVISEFFNAVGDGFRVLEDLANQMIDLIDANSTHESFLLALGNLFNLKLRSNDPTLWRRQIKEAIPLFKKKGTLSGLSRGLAQAGISLTKLTRLWQVVSPYTWQEVFVVEDQTSFELSKQIVTPVNVDNFELYYREVDGEWIQLNSDYVIVSGNTISWIGEQLSLSPIILGEGDEIRVLYEINDASDNQALEDYIRTLPLWDQRDEKDQIYPVKNWNVRVIEEDDPLFDIVIPTRHPFYDPVIYGKVRTEFPYSENVYNMDEYNGSKRDSENPCDINREFVDECSQCQSSSFSIDLDIEELSNDRITEAQEIIADYIPFHAQIHSMNINGVVNEYCESPQEEIQLLQQYTQEEFVLAGEGQMIFNRHMDEGLDAKKIVREALAEMEVVVSSQTGTAYNDSVILYSDGVMFDSLPIIFGSNVLEILAPSSWSGDYSVSDPHKTQISVSGISEPISPTSSFTYRLSNDIYSNSNTAIYQDDVFKLSDTELDFVEIGVQDTWSIKFITGGYPSGFFDINTVLSDDSFILDNPSQNIPVANVTGLKYQLYDDDLNLIATSMTGVLRFSRRGRVDVSSDGSRADMRNFVEIGDYVLYSGDQYKISGFGGTHIFYIDAYTSGDVAGQITHVYRRLLDNKIGYLDYSGINLNTSTDFEATLPILNGQNAPSEDNIVEGSNFKENYLIKIGSDYYSISDIDGTTITLNGPPQVWTTLGAGGTSVNFDILHYVKTSFSVQEREYPATPGHFFDIYDRRGTSIIEIETEQVPTMSFMPMFLNNSKNDTLIDIISQQESISLQIDWQDENE